MLAGPEDRPLWELWGLWVRWFVLGLSVVTLVVLTAAAHLVPAHCMGEALC